MQFGIFSVGDVTTDPTTGRTPSEAERIASMTQLALKAEEVGLINHCVAAQDLDGVVDAFCERLLNGATNAIRWTKVLLNMELKRVAHSVMDAGIAYESVAVRSADHREGVRALIEKRKPVFGSGCEESGDRD